MKPQHQIQRRRSRPIQVGKFTVGGDAPISVQTMTNTDTEDVAATIDQVRAAVKAGADMVLLCNSDEATDQVLELAELSPQSEASRRRLEMMRPDAAYRADDALMNEAREQVTRYI